ncbi:MAG: HAD family hydrolase [Duncaniella sp.]|nr:HAD family hydrolase [Muribaculum sp.]MCM1255573.1 HAD family hydrolase [Duncaniella sp.]
MKHLIIFDLDGTLLNTIEDLGAATNYALHECGYPIHNLSSYPMFVGNGVSRLIERSLPEDERSAENVARLREKFTVYYDEHCADLTKPYPGIMETLNTLQEMGVRMAVASNKYQSAVERLIDHFFPQIEWAAIEGQKEGVPVKPDPSIVFEILAKSPTRKSKVLYVGDSGVDMETARRACVDSAGVTWGFRPVKELRDYHADNIVNSPEELITIVKRPGLELDV